jgi:hypothetical protein
MANSPQFPQKARISVSAIVPLLSLAEIGELTADEPRM